MNLQAKASIALERTQLKVRRHLFMSTFVRNSAATLENEIKRHFPTMPKDSRIGIFGTYEAARLIHSLLLAHGYHNLFFFASEPKGKSFRNFPLLNICDPEVMSADSLLTTSLARSAVQRDHLLSLGYRGRILCLPDLKHLSTSFMQDASTPGKVAALEQRHKNQPAFIIGNGPTLQKTDPRTIPDKFISFAGNGIVRLSDFAPDYFFALESKAIQMWTQEIATLPSQKLFAAHVKKQLVGPAAQFNTGNNIFFPACYEQQRELFVNNWREEGFESGNTVICPMLQFALLMGCSPIYILGVDLTYKPNDQSYFCSNYHPQDVRSYQEDEINGFQNRMLRSIGRAVEACHRAGVEIYNCSPTRNIDFLEYREFAEIIQ